MLGGLSVSTARATLVSTTTRSLPSTAGCHGVSPGVSSGTESTLTNIAKLRPTRCTRWNRSTSEMASGREASASHMRSRRVRTPSSFQYESQAEVGSLPMSPMRLNAVVASFTCRQGCQDACHNPRVRCASRRCRSSESWLRRGRTHTPVCGRAPDSVHVGDRLNRRSGKGSLVTHDHHVAICGASRGR